MVEGNSSPLSVCLPLSCIFMSIVTDWTRVDKHRSLYHAEMKALIETTLLKLPVQRGTLFSDILNYIVQIKL